MRLESFVWKRFEKSDRNALNLIVEFKYCRKNCTNEKKKNQKKELFNLLKSNMMISLKRLKAWKKFIIQNNKKAKH